MISISHLDLNFLYQSHITPKTVPLPFLFYHLIGLICGIYLQMTYDIFYGIFFALIFTALTLVITEYNEKKSLKIVSLLLSIVMGAAVYKKNENIFQAQQCIIKNNTALNLNAIVKNIVIKKEKPYIRKIILHTQFFNNNGIPVILPLLVKCYTPLPCSIGQHVTISLKNNVKLYSLQQAMRIGVLGEVSITKEFFTIDCATKHFQIFDIIEIHKNNFYKKIITKLPYKLRHFIALYFFGNKEDLRWDSMHKIKQMHAQWGISHYLARSGLHCTIIMASWYFILSSIPIPLYVKTIIMLLFGLLYAMFSWSSLSFLRALCMYILYQIGIALKKQTNMIHILSLVAYAFLLYNPCVLFFLDFQLTFGITFLLFFINLLEYTAIHKERSMLKKDYAH